MWRRLAKRFPDLRLYLVGGAVRDRLLGRTPRENDLLVLGADVAEVARALAEETGGRLQVWPEFRTARVVSKDGVFDLANPREERYPEVGGLPRIAAGDLKADLARRDFSVNAILYRLRPAPEVLIDPYSGLRDLEEGRLRPLRKGSFVEDPTRVLRGLRLVARLGLWPGEEFGEELARLEKRPEAARRARQRLFAELDRLFAEKGLEKALQVAKTHRIFERLFGQALDDGAVEALLRTQAPKARRILFLSALSDPSGLGAKRDELRAAELLRRPPATPGPLWALGEAAISAFLARYPERQAFATPPWKPLKGADLVALGLVPGPAVGKVLSQLARAREEGRIRSPEEELMLARKLVEAYGSS